MDNSEKKTTNRVGSRFSVFELEKIAEGLIGNADNRRFAQNVSNLFAGADPMTYAAEDNKAACLFLIKKLTDMIINSSVALPRDIIIDSLDLSGRYSDSAAVELEEIKSQSISDQELKALDTKISQELKYNIIAQKTDALTKQLTDIKTQNYDDLGNALEKLEGTITDVDYTFKHSRETVDENKNTLVFDATNMPSLETRFDAISQKLNDPSTTVRTGIQIFNTILDGGYKAERLYVALGVAKAGKSKFLLDSAIWARKFNNLKAKDSSKKPVIIYLTLENSVDETVVRLYNYATDDNGDMRGVDGATIAQKFAEAGIFGEPPSEFATDDIETPKPDILIMYRPNNSINVPDIRVMLDEEEKKGNECVFLVIDYMKRLRATHPSKDSNGLRFDLGEITNDLHTLAIDKDIPILTAMQLNRNALADLDQAITLQEKVSAFAKIGGSNIGESIDIVQNADCVFSINPLMDQKISPDGAVEYTEKYLAFNILANRMRSGTDVDTFAQPYVDGNFMRLIEDADSSTPSYVSIQQLKNKNLVSSACIAANKLGRRDL
jgi:replicative DNA helicase